MEPIDEKLLLAEYNHFSESLWRNEEMGEKRVSYFISLVTAVLTGLIAIDVTNLGDQVDLPRMVLAFLIILFVLGVLTYLRMLRRNRVTDEYIAIIKYLREEMRVRSITLTDYQIKFRKPGTLLRGGLAETMAALNALISGALIYFLGKGDNDDITALLWLLIVLGATIVFAIQAIPVVKRRMRRAGTDQSAARAAGTLYPQSFRAGVGILVQGRDGRLLAFERRDFKDSWQFPQGGINGDETPHEAAERELREETGLGKEHVSGPLYPPVLTVYDLPPDYRSSKTGRGQAQYWFLFTFQGTDADINLGDGEEFSGWEWMPFETVIDKTVHFRKPVYRQLKAAFHLHQPQS